MILNPKLNLSPEEITEITSVPVNLINSMKESIRKNERFDHFISQLKQKQNEDPTDNPATDNINREG